MEKAHIERSNDLKWYETNVSLRVHLHREQSLSQICEQIIILAKFYQARPLDAG